MFERCTCINLDRRPERWDKFCANVMLVKEWPGPPPVRVSGVDGVRTGTPRKWVGGPGAWGCMATYRRILEDALKDGVQTLLMLEDDARFPEDFGARVRNFLRLVPDWEWVYLGGEHCGPQPPKIIRPGVVTPSQVCRTHAWALRGKRMIQRVYQHSLNVERHIDWGLTEIQHKEPTCYCVHPWIVPQGPNSSDIDGREHAERSWDREPIKLMEGGRGIVSDFMGAPRVKPAGQHPMAVPAGGRLGKQADPPVR